MGIGRKLGTPVLSVEQMNAAETLLEISGVTYFEMMQHAGMSVALEILNHALFLKKDVVIFVGTGNNGGDGYIIASILANRGFNVSVVQVYGAPQTDLAQAAFSRLPQSVQVYEEATLYEKQLEREVEQADYIVDAIFGTGFSGKLDNRMHSIAMWVNMFDAVVVAVDIPSGIPGDCDDTFLVTEAIRADITVVLSAFKKAHVNKANHQWMGKMIIGDVGITPDVFEQLPLNELAITAADVTEFLPKRDDDAHKGSFGKVLLLCGSEAMMGAVIIAAKSAYRMGAGIVYCAIPSTCFSVLQSALPEAVCIDRKGLFSELEKINDYDSIVIGSGYGQTRELEKLLKEIFLVAGKPLVLDADALNIIASDKKLKQLMMKYPAPCVITPHPLEMERLTNVKISSRDQGRIEIANNYAHEYKVITVLKGKSTITSLPTRRHFVNTTGNPGLAKAGSGDALAGIIGSLIAQGHSAEVASSVGVYLHGLAADKVKEVMGEYSMMITDVIEMLPTVLKEFNR